MKLFIHENASENIIWGMAAILARGRWVNYGIGLGDMSHILTQFNYNILASYHMVSLPIVA